MEKRKQRKEIYKGRIIRVFRDTVDIEGRSTVRELITHPGSSVIIPVLSSDPVKIILIDQYRYAAGKRLLELPAGTKAKGETTLQCAKREIREETGYKAASFRKILGLYPSPGVMTEYMDIYAATGLEYAPLRCDPDEDIKTVIMRLKKAEQLALNGTIEDAKSIAGILAFSAMIRSGGFRSFSL